MKKSIYLIAFLSLSLPLQAQQEDIVKLYNQAQMAVEMGYLDDAIDLYKQVLEINPQFAKGYLELGNIYLKKGQDVNSLTNAYHYLSGYLSIDPNAQNAQTIKNTLDKLEYALQKTTQKEAARDFLLGRWASTDGRTDKYARSNFLLDISEFDNKIRIDIDPSSLFYTPDFNYKTVYIDNPNDDQYAFTFTNDKTYLPSQAGYDFNRTLINHVANQLPGGDILGGIGNLINSSKQEKDLQKKTITVYELKLNPVPNESQELSCKGRIYKKEISPLGEKTLLDSVFTTSFYKVKSGYVNRAIIKFRDVHLQYEDQQINKMLLKEINWVDINDQIKKMWSQDNRELFQFYKRANRKQTIGESFTGFAIVPFALGVLFWAGTTPNMINEDFTRKDYENQLKVGKITTLISGGLMAIGIPLWINGKAEKKKAVNLYNESIYKAIENREETSHLKIGVSNNSIDLTFTF
ncbi:MAG: tetratricopeptide repeat protein [Candidatus Azobacteroides sp.]|nr:tetratricopeptide repeat protein [Candidatus Azobacteroides sp.]